MNTLYTVLSAGGCLAWANPLAPALSNTRCRSLSASGGGGCCVYVRMCVGGEVVVFCVHMCICVCTWGGDGGLYGGWGVEGDCSGWVCHQGHSPQHTVSIAVTLHCHKQATWSLTAWQTRPRGLSLNPHTLFFPSLTFSKLHYALTA